MAYPTKITLTSGKTEYGGSTDGEGITSRQVRVSVTYELERQDEDLLVVTERKAREVEEAQAAVWRQVRKEQGELGRATPPHSLPKDEGPEDEGPEDEEDDPLRPYGEESPDEEHDGESSDGWNSDGDAPGDSEDQDPTAHHLEQHPTGNGASPWNSHTCRTGTSAGKACGEKVSESGPVPQTVTEPQPLPMTKPQKLALEAAARRLGLSDTALADLIRKRFGKSSFTARYAVERLSKVEAGELLRSLAALA
jgi:hypothetical protein